MKALFVCGDRLRHFADSAQQRNGQAWFIPDTGVEWVAVVCPAIKITRLGTHIAQKFAGRYFDSISAACIFMPATAADNIADASERFFICDSAYCIGDSVGSDDAATVHKIVVGDESLSFSCADLEVDRIISELSRFSTLKMGDLIIFGDRSLVSKVAEGDRIEVTIDGERSVSLRIK